MNQRVIITGATRGLGLSLAESFLQAGDEVIGISRTRKHWTTASRRLGGSSRFSLYQADLTSESAVCRLAGKVRASRKPADILVNNAGCGGKLTTVSQLPLRAYEKMMAGNLTSAFLMCKHFIPSMRALKNSLIVNVASMAGVRAVPRLFAYSASKYGMIALTQCVAKENEDTGLRCLSICPGGMNTRMRSDLFGARDAARQQSPEFVAHVMMDIVTGRTPVNSGSAVVIRHGKVWAVQPMPAA